MSEQAAVSWAPPRAGSGAIESESLLVLGYSQTSRSALKVWLRSIDLEAGDWIGVNAAFPKARGAKPFSDRRKK